MRLAFRLPPRTNFPYESALWRTLLQKKHDMEAPRKHTTSRVWRGKLWFWVSAHGDGKQTNLDALLPDDVEVLIRHAHDLVHVFLSPRVTPKRENKVHTNMPGE